MLEGKIIAPVRHSSWVANLLPIRRKNGEIRLHVDFRNLNQLFVKVNYLLLIMEHLL